MTGGNLGKICQLVIDLHLPVIRVIAAGQIGGGADGIACLCADRAHKALGGSLVYQGGVNAYREGPFRALDPAGIRCNGEAPKSHRPAD